MHGKRLIVSGALTLLGALASVSVLAQAPLADAVQQGRKELVRSLITDRARVNVPQVDGTTALHWAVRHDDVATADALIKAGANVKAANRYGLTPLYLAAVNGNVVMIARLLAAGADPNASVPDGETALMTAARTGRVDAVKVLLDRGADVNAREDRRAQTALMWAVVENHAPVVKLLVASGADVNAQTTTRPQRGRLLRNGFGSPKEAVAIPFAAPPTDGGMTPLLFAIRDGDMEMAQFLVEKGARLELASANQTTPLVLAILNGQVEIATWLLERGGNPNTVDSYGRGALFAAVDQRNFNFQRYGDQPTDGRDPLDLIKALLVKGANPNQRTSNVPIHGHLTLNEAWVDFDGQTPFIRAALSGDVTVMRLLLDYKADPLMTTNKGATALMAAAGVNWKRTQTFTRTEDEFVQAVTLCLDRGLDVNAATSQGLTAMHGAAHRGWTSVIQLLADRGAKLDARDIQGRPPIDFTKGIFLTVATSDPQPAARALLEKLMGGK